jgi:hypothetical protein
MAPTAHASAVLAQVTGARHGSLRHRYLAVLRAVSRWLPDYVPGPAVVHDLLSPRLSGGAYRHATQASAPLGMGAR